MANLSFSDIISDSKIIILCCFIENFRLKIDKNSNKLLVYYRFSCKNPTQKINVFIVLCSFCLVATRHS